MGKYWNVLGMRVPATLGLIIVALVAVQYLGVYDWYGQLGLSAAAGPVVTDSGVLCDNGDNKPVVDYGAYYVDPTNNHQKVPATTLASFYIPGEPTCRVYTTFSGSNQTSVSNLACMQNYNLVLGDSGNVTYYYEVIPITADKTVTTISQVELTRAGAPSISISNVSDFEQTSVTIDNSSFTTGNIGTATLNLIVKKTQDGTCYGSHGWGICFRSNVTSFKQWQPMGYLSTFSQTSIQGQTGQALVQCYKMSNEPLCSGVLTIPLQGECASGVSCAGEDDAVDILLKDFVGVPFNGDLVVGTDTGVSTGTSADVGRADPELANAIVFIDG